MELTKNHVAVAKFASTSTVREELASVLIKDGKVVATDSFRLVELPIECDADAMPVLISAKAFGKLKGKAITGQTGHQGLIVDVDGFGALLPSLDAGRFPDYEKLVPTADPEASVRINGRFLAEVLSLLAKTDPFETVQVDFHGQAKPVVISTKAGRGLVMPVVAR